MSINLDELLAKLDDAQEKTAEQAFNEALASEKTASEPAEEKVAEAQKAEPAVSDVDLDLQEKIAELVEDKLVKSAGEFGKIAAMSFFGELAALGIALPTNNDIQVPPVSQVSQPMESPVTVAADAKDQMQAGHDAYDKNHKHVETEAGYMKVKTASVISPDFIKNLKNKIYGE